MELSSVNYLRHRKVTNQTLEPDFPAILILLKSIWNNVKEYGIAEKEETATPGTHQVQKKQKVFEKNT